MAKRKRIPKVIWLPFGYKIDVEQRRINDASGLWYAGPKGGVIVINKHDPYVERLETLGHELAHAVTDYRHWITQEIIDPLVAETMETEHDD